MSTCDMNHDDERCGVRHQLYLGTRNWESVFVPEATVPLDAQKVSLLVSRPSLMVGGSERMASDLRRSASLVTIGSQE